MEGYREIAKVWKGRRGDSREAKKWKGIGGEGVLRKERYGKGKI